MHTVCNAEHEIVGSITHDEYLRVLLFVDAWTPVITPATTSRIKITRTLTVDDQTFYPGYCILCQEN